MVVPTPVGRPECYREQSGLTGVLPTLEIEYSVTTVAPAQPFPKLGENDRTGMHATVAYTSNNLPDAGHAAAQDTAYDAYRNRTRTLAQRGSGPNAPPQYKVGSSGPDRELVSKRRLLTWA